MSALRHKPFLKWAGGKSKLVPLISAQLPKVSRLIEPFAGAASISLALDFDEYWLNDANADVIGLYKTLQQERQAFIDYAGSFFTAEHNQEAVFYALREQFNATHDRTMRAALFLYLNRHGFNGLCRYNQKGRFNVPFGRYKSPYFPKAEMQYFIEKSPKMRFFCGDFAPMLTGLSDNDAVYCDPPYAPLESAQSFVAYQQGGFDLAEQRRLASLVEQVWHKPRALVLSNHDTPFVRRLYPNASVQTIAVQRNIAATGARRKKVDELLLVYKRDGVCVQ